MRKTKTRLLSLLMLLVMLFGMLPTAYADPVADLDVGEDTEVVNGFGASYATADAEPAEFTIIVPTKLPFAILKDGQTLKATNAAIRNRSNGPVTLDGISAEGKGWAIVPEDTDFNAVPVNSRQLTLKLNNDQVPAALPDTRVGVPMTQADWSSPGADDGSIYGQSDLPFTYDGSFAPQSNASEEAVIAHVIFTIAWKYDDAPFVIGDILDFYTFVILDDGTVEITGVNPDVPEDTELPVITPYVRSPITGEPVAVHVRPGAIDGWTGKKPVIRGHSTGGSGSSGSSGSSIGVGSTVSSSYSGNGYYIGGSSSTPIGQTTRIYYPTGLPEGTIITGITNHNPGVSTLSTSGGSGTRVGSDGGAYLNYNPSSPGHGGHTIYYRTPDGRTSSTYVHTDYPVTITNTEDYEPHPTPTVKSYDKRLLIELPVGEKHNGARTYSIWSEDPTIAEAYEVEDFVVTNGVYKYWLVPHKEGDVLITIILTDGTMLRDHVMIRNSTTAAKNGSKYTISVPNEYEGKTVKRFVLTDPELADVSVAPGTVVKNGQFEVTVNPKKNGHCDYIVEFTDGTSVRSNSQLYISLSGSGSGTGDGSHDGESTTTKTITKPETTGTVNIGVGEYSNYIKCYDGPVFICDGQPHFPTFDFADGAYALSGTTAAKTEPGSYRTFIKPANGYKWSDGTDGLIACLWEIKKDNSATIKKPTVTTQYDKGGELQRWGAYFYPSFELDGKEHFPIFDYPENSYRLLETTTAQTQHKDPYYVTFIYPTNGYTWDDGTTDVIACLWNIGGDMRTPTAKSLTYDGTAQKLVNPGIAADGNSVLYKLSGGNYGKEIPTATDAGTYVVYYKITNANNQNEVIENTIETTIARKRLSNPMPATFTNDGKSHFPSYNYPEGSVTFSGITTPQAENGKYTTTITPTKNYMWADGTTSAKDTTWSIIRSMPSFVGGEVFGVKWDSSSTSTYLTRLTKSNDPYHFVNTDIKSSPSPVGKNSRGSSPFDNYMPYAGMEQYNIVDNEIGPKKGETGFSNKNGDTMVYIPEFYYRVVVDGTTTYYYLANHPVDGFEKHPGSGCFVGRYASGDGYVSQSGKTPLVNITRANARTGSMAKGSNWSQFDFATLQAIQYLYVIEFACWDSQGSIGYGYVNLNSSAASSGCTDGLSYCTGCTGGSKNEFVQYRWIENLWGNVHQWVDGINFYDRTAYISTNYKQYADDTSSGYIMASTMPGPGSGHITGFATSESAPWAFIPGTVNATSSANMRYQIPDIMYSADGWRAPYSGGFWRNTQYAGLFYFDASKEASFTWSNVASRLVYHP